MTYRNSDPSNPFSDLAACAKTDMGVVFLPVQQVPNSTSSAPVQSLLEAERACAGVRVSVSGRYPELPFCASLVEMGLDWRCQVGGT